MVAPPHAHPSLLLWYIVRARVGRGSCKVSGGAVLTCLFASRIFFLQESLSCCPVPSLFPERDMGDKEFCLRPPASSPSLRHQLIFPREKEVCRQQTFSLPSVPCPAFQAGQKDSSEVREGESAVAWKVSAAGESEEERDA